METQKTNQLVTATLSSKEFSDLEHVLGAVKEQRNALTRLSGLMGEAVGGALHYGSQSLSMVPRVQQTIDKAARKALMKAFDISLVGLPSKGQSQSFLQFSTPVKRASVAISGVLGGFSGILGLLPDISYTTLAIMREIAQIAQEEGEDLEDPNTRAACLEVFAFKAMNDPKDQDIELGFFSARTFLRGQSMMMLMGDVASHYGFALGRKLSLRMMPVAGALFGASLNTAFFNHYRAVAKARFRVRRLEREHGLLVRDVVKEIYKKLNED